MIDFISRVFARKRTPPSRALRALIALLVSIIEIPDASAQKARGSAVRLEVAPEAAACIAEEALRAEVARPIGTEPFVRDAAVTLFVALHRRGSALLARALLRENTGKLLWQTEIEEPSGQCSKLLADLGLAIAIELMPEDLPACPVPPVQSAPEGSPARPPEPSARASGQGLRRAPRAAPASSPAEQPELRFEMGVSAVASLGFTPSPGVGSAGLLRLRWPSLSLGVEARAFAPATAEEARAAPFTVEALSGMAVGCGHQGIFLGCGLLEVGRLRARGSGALAEDEFALVTAGGRTGIEVPIWRGLRARAYADVAFGFTPTRILVDERDAWALPWLSGSAGAGLVSSFW